MFRNSVDVVLLHYFVLLNPETVLLTVTKLW